MLVHSKKFWVKVTMDVILPHTVIDNGNLYVVSITSYSNIYSRWVVVTHLAYHNPPSFK